MNSFTISLISVLIWEILILAVNYSGLTVGMVLLPRRDFTINICFPHIGLDQVKE